MKINNNIIKNYAKEHRINKGLNQIELAKKSKISVRQLQRIEALQQDPKISTLFNIANSLNLTIEELFRPPRKNSSSKNNDSK